MPTRYFSLQPTLSSPAQDTETLKAVWRTIDADSCPHSYNFHLHTVYSDGQLQPEAVIEQALALNLRGLAITDHHSVKGYQIAQKYFQQHRQASSSRLHLWVGVEITSVLLATEVHILGYGFDPNHPSIEVYLQGTAPVGQPAAAENVILAIHEAGGLAVLAHPERYHRPAQDLIAAAVVCGLDGVETYYAYRNVIPWTPTPQKTAHVKALGEQYNLFHTCGTDTHGLNLLQRI